MPTIQFTKKDKIRHIASWALITLYIFLFDMAPGSVFKNSVCILINMLNLIIVYYSLCLFVFPRFGNKHLVAALFIVLNYLLFVAIGYVNQYIISPALNILSNDHYDPLYRVFLGSFLLYILTVFASLTFFLHKLRVYKLLQHYEHERSVISNELIFFRRQLNSSLAFDFFGYCHRLVHKRSKKTARAIQLYTGILQYTQRLKPDEKVKVSDEIEHIENHLLLRKALHPKTYVVFNYPGGVDNTYIVCRVLITFIENALKHGVTNDPDHPVRACLEVSNGNLRFAVSNKVNPHKKVVSTGTGLENARQALALNYKDNYTLHQAQGGDYYHTTLTVNIE